MKLPALSKRSQDLWEQLHGEYEFSSADEAVLHRSLEAYDLADALQASARSAGVASKEARAMLSASRDAASVALKHWQALGFGKADHGARRPGRPAGAHWSRQRREARRAGIRPALPAA